MNAPRPPTLSRRRFLAAGLGFPAIIPAVALGKNGATAPGNRIGVGFIGCGQRLSVLMKAFLRQPDVQTTAICDPIRHRREAFARFVGKEGGRVRRDFREVLARSDVDAVVIATPDHWHGVMAVMAAEAGKDIYCESPLANSVPESRAVVDACRRFGVVLQHGTQLLHGKPCRQATEIIRNSRLGTIQHILIGTPKGRVHGLPEIERPPADIDYDHWLGPAPDLPYATSRVFPVDGIPGWKFIHAHRRGGTLAGYGTHDIALVQRIFGVGAPSSIEGRATWPANGLFDTPLDFALEMTFPGLPTVRWGDTGRERFGITIVGSKGRLWLRDRIEAEPAELLAYDAPADGLRLPESPESIRDFLEAIKTRRDPACPAEVGHASVCTVAAAAAALRTKRPLHWDSTHERFIRDTPADRLLTAPLRPPWGL